jgi:hypothetical protein
VGSSKSPKAARESNERVDAMRGQSSTDQHVPDENLKKEEDMQTGHHHSVRGKTAVTLFASVIDVIMEADQLIN